MSRAFLKAKESALWHDFHYGFDSLIFVKKKTMRARKAFRLTVIAAAAALITSTALAQVFTIKDIRIEGIQRTEPGTVFSHLPFQVGDEYTPERGTEAIHDLYESGLFRDVGLSSEGDVLVVSLVERPAVAAIEINGVKAFDKDGALKSLRDVGLAEGRIFDSSILDRAEQEMRRMYLSKGYYGVTVDKTTTPVERNRVKVSINVNEGLASSIKEIRFVGNTIFDNDELLDQMQLHPHKWSSFYTKRDMYSREKLAADLESIRSFYLNQGYLDFRIDSTQVSMAPNKSDIFVTINLSEGEQYKVSNVTLAGDMLDLESEINPLIAKIKSGDIYNAERVNDVGKEIAEKFSALGYAFCTATPNPVTDEKNQTVNIVYTIDPGRRAYVRHVNIVGNSRTRDVVIRREVRQYESAWFNSDKVKLSRDRIDRLGYFDSVEVNHVPVEGTRDEVDLEVKVKERPTGSISLGAGYSSDDGVILSAGFAQNNIFGTGNSFSIDVNTSKSQRTVALSLGEPYITPEGISRNWELYDRRTDLDELDVSNVAYETFGGGIDFGIPVTELDTIYVGAKLEATKVTTRGNKTDSMKGKYSSSPYRYFKYVDDYGKTSKAALFTVGWARDSRDSPLAPTRGRYQRFSSEVSLPGLDLQYYRATYQITQYLPLSKNWTLGLNMQAGYGDSYGNKDYPFFKNFYAGGIGSVRGYESSSLGPRDIGNDDNLGGDRQLIFSAELLTPLPGADKTLRGLVFFDAGTVWGYKANGRNADGYPTYKRQKIDFGDLRYSWGFGIAWISPLGPLKFSLAFPINKKKGDDTERFQFQIGTGF